MKHVGDITKLHGADLEPVDVVTGGSPCQDLSVAGKRAGLAGERSGLFMEQIRVIKELRKHDRRNGKPAYLARPRYMVWENVPGALSSNNGEDFHAVLEETAKIADENANIPGLEGGGGQTSGALWVPGGLLLGEYTTHSFGECPREENVSHLSQILEEEAHQKYYLSAKACAGILARASRRGKALPEVLQKALEEQAARHTY